MDRSSHYLVIFLNSRYGYYQMQRWFTGNIQMHLNLTDCKEILIPILTSSFQNTQKKLFETALSLLGNSNNLYQQAEDLLLSELGLKDWQPTEETIAIKSFSESFLSSGRLDAEHYQPKFDELIETISSSAIYLKRVRDIQKFNSRGLQPIYSEDGKLNVINSRHILERHLDYENFERTDFENWNTKGRARVYKNDILIYTTGANIGRTNVYLSDEKALASNHVNILRLKEEDQVYVGFVINSVIGRLQTEKLSAGSAQAELYPKDIDSFVIPFVAKDKQQQIVNQYILSLDQQKKSKQLLEIAKTGVERAIETDEQGAIAWMNQQLEVLGVDLS